MKRQKKYEKKKETRDKVEKGKYYHGLYKKTIKLE